jgi:hypothetical protein
MIEPGSYAEEIPERFVAPSLTSLRSVISNVGEEEHA